MIWTAGNFPVIKPNQYNPLDEQICKISIYMYFLVVSEVYLLMNSPLCRVNLGSSALRSDHKQNPMLIKQLKDSGKNSQQMVNISLRENKWYFLAWNITMCTICVCIERYVCTCEILLTVERGVASARSVSIVIEMILTAGAHQRIPLWLWLT